VSWTIEVLKQLGDPRLEGIAALVNSAPAEPESLRNRRILFRDAPPADEAMQHLLDRAPASLVIPDLAVWRALAGTCVPRAPEPGRLSQRLDNILLQPQRILKPGKE